MKRSLPNYDPQTAARKITELTDLLSLACETLDTNDLSSPMLRNWFENYGATQIKITERDALKKSLYGTGNNGWGNPDYAKMIRLDDEIMDFLGVKSL